MSAPAWELQEVRRSFGGGGLLRRRPSHRAVDGVSLSVAPGERVALIGESGSGKSTLARVGLGLLRPDSGGVRLFGEDTTGWSEARWRAARRHAQLLFQDPRAMLNPEMRIGALLHESARLHRPDADADAEVRQVLEQVGLGGRADARPFQLSGGEQRRAGLARLLLARPRLVVADEPTAGLDAALKASLIELLVERLGPDCALVLISHDLPVVAWACQRVLVMQAGRIVDRFPTAEIPQGRKRHPATAALLSAAGLLATPSTREAGA